MTLPATLATKLKLLIPRLASEFEGEIVATIRAINRTLRSAKLDWHDLAQAISDEPRPEIVFVYRDRPSREPDTWLTIARYCRDNALKGRLSAKEREFIHDMCRRLVCGGKPTERQANWLRTLCAKVGGP
jgi:hypothetical protein